MTREEALKKAINIVCYFEAHFAKSKEAREDAVNIIEVLEQEPCEDCISRQAVLDKEVYTETSDGWTGWTVDVNDIKELPSVKPEQKIGRWIYHDGYIPYKHECSECGKRFGTDFNYCPNCGTKMCGGDSDG